MPTQNAMVVGGNFSSVGSLPCLSVCSFNTASLQWNSLGSGLIGEVNDMIVVDVSNKLKTKKNDNSNLIPYYIFTCRINWLLVVI